MPVPYDDARETRDRRRILVLSTTAFTLMFAVWLMFGVLGIPIRDELGLSDVQLSWLASVAILNGALWRLPAGIAADRFGGRRVFIAMLLVTAVPAYLISQATSYTGAARLRLPGRLRRERLQRRHRVELGLVPARAAGLRARRLRSRQRRRLGHQVRGAGRHRDRPGRRLRQRRHPRRLAPGALLLRRGAGGHGRHDVDPGAQARPQARLGPAAPGDADAVEHAAGLALQHVLRRRLRCVRRPRGLAAQVLRRRVRRAAVRRQALLTALFIFPASLLRPFGGYLSDRYGARRVMYGTFATMLLSTGLLMMPFGHIVLYVPSSYEADGVREVLPYQLGIVPFTAALFVVGIAMGIGKAAVYKHIPEYFPHDVGAVGGLVGTLGALGGFLLPPLFAYGTRWTGLPQTTFFVLFVLTAVAALWMHLTVHRMLHHNSPELAGNLEIVHATEGTSS
jgi:NNP family nitrate/nitrite transporter-like MFS transporter